MSKPSTSNDAKQLIRNALYKVLSSLVRLVVRQGITFPEFADMLKRAYVEEVQKELKSNKERITLSRISVISGVHRKDVKRLTDTPELDGDKNEKVSLTSRLLSLWMGDSQFLDAQGDPLLLPRTGAPSFESLVYAVSSDIRPRTVLDDWLQRGLIQGDEKGYRLMMDALFPTEDMATKMAFFARNTADHIATCEHNIRSEKTPLPERSVFYNHLSEDSIIALRKLADDESKALLIRINKRAQALAKQDDAGLKGQYRFLLGTYFYQTEDTQND
ncbi:hypothetical protein EBI01_10185 [Marinomonas rhizomae]|uniref:Uncharacterized protein n=1 Tax=Marinomonas rhizomae TaxID=491948 RepID=A0A366JBL2_9GAMM|nr:DUF6502 family protein [Marinomonas rhizomae]RBP83749.1 hypothetical protein DFP80_10569 [Marinomonas rhizomae]RNF73534.1 hypothetical protein EBI01_10185 [Marinomonas rhizomae]